MILLKAENLRKHYGTQTVLDGVALEVQAGERIGLLGPNGSGKTTLLKILAGLEEPDGGTVNRRSDIQVGYLEQQPNFLPDRTVWQEAFAAVQHWAALGQQAVQIAHQLSQCTDPQEHRRLAAQFDQIHQLLQHHQAYHLDRNVQQVLTGLGFSKQQWEQPVGQLSGGEQSRLLLAKLLLGQHELLLLDEPSNHLDLEMTLWLEEYLLSCSSAMILVSHDRYFLDRVCTRIVELFQGKVESYPGNYSAYCRLKAERLLVQRRTYEKQQAAIAKAEEFIRRYSYGQRHAQAQDRRKKLARIQPVEPPREITGPPMSFGTPSRSGDIVLRVEGLSKGFERVLFRDLSFQILRGQRWGILGPNGSGKTTLLKCILGQLPPDSGRVELGHGVVIGYFDQHGTQLPEQEPVVDAIRPPSGQMETQERRDLLARFGITGDRALQPVRCLSGGERNRANLARLAALGANFLLLDEPTNHLDLWARQSLEKALQEFPGTVLFVSHDRYFINQVADHLIVLQPDRVRIVEGNYETYRHLAQTLWSQPSPAPKPQPSSPKLTAQPPEQKPRRKRKFPYRKLEDLEAEIFQRETRLEELYQLLATPEVYRNGQRVREVQQEIEEQKQALARLYEHWEEAVELDL
ncbi:MAG: ABC-F family ATP-binding cassette domain-containing protein [Thermoguttaceae bacterium]|nr:ABC-F family ATP-binding cassette domain-containing protein [Thermoguttaceae bacterium]MDW8038899.1 ABC-F family ATP-binding cassette domain-containing protein [Thermoguttaceae bacterium]